MDIQGGGDVNFGVECPAQLVGRDDDLALIGAFLDEASVNGRALLLVGEPGVGKTVVLDESIAMAAARGIRVLRAGGVEFEASVAYSGLNQLLFPLRESFGELSDVHREALEVALGFGGGRPPNRLLMSNAALLCVRNAAVRRPLLLVVDDLPWLDRASATVLGFVARRLAGSRVGFLGAARSHTGSSFEGGDLPDHELRPLDGTAASELVARRFPALAPSVRQRLLSEARGNPLALLELPQALTSPQQQAVESLPAVLPLTQRLQALFASRISALPEACRNIMLLAALDRSGGRDALRAAAACYGLESVAPAEHDQLVHVDEVAGRFEFRHPLIRSAVVDVSTAVERRGAHRRLAEVMGEHPERRAWHLGEGVVGPDEHVAQRLEEAAHLAQSRGDAVGAIASLTRAADLSLNSVVRASRLAEAAYLGVDSVGELLSASHLLDEARRTNPAGGASLHAVIATAILLIDGDGDVLTAHKLLAEAIETSAKRADAPEKALVEALYTLLLLCWFAGRRELWEPAFAAIDRLTPNVPESLWILSRTYSDPARMAQAATPVLDALLDVVCDETDPTRIVRLGAASFYLDRLPATRDGHWWIVREGREGRIAVRRHVAALMHLCHDTFHTGRWDTMAELTNEGARLCEEHGYRFFIWYFRHARGLHAAVRGDHEASQEVTDELMRWAGARGARGVEWVVIHARTLNYIGQSDYEAAYREAIVHNEPGTIASHIPHAMWTSFDLVEAAFKTERTAQAGAHAAAMREADLPALSTRLALLTAGAGAMVADDDQFVDAFDAALALPGNPRWPFDFARVRLAYGERLRRARATAGARLQLSAAAEIFERLGAQPWLERAGNELRATGISKPRGCTTTSPVLTPQQRVIAELAGSGLTNKQIGERLFLSHRTVGARLYQIYPILGITSRAALRDALTALPEDPPDGDMPAGLSGQPGDGT
ncbi:helix-turn-helix transcriptional regulator [Pseudonocardia alaniniphila]|uniref:AAA family ATPase n=1 Tax=Pseudonocardia alaniniphila TaxID=75291 RepID=A0ABS9T8M0_9PSEU|nr:LuxR family transcriptional regulator [Pseudonocardia alaniniphila]MCH6164860.1 AAA family ATPase [Pseudonocardia alaniniphila]